MAHGCSHQVKLPTGSPTTLQAFGVFRNSVFSLENIDRSTEVFHIANIKIRMPIPAFALPSVWDKARVKNLMRKN